MKELTLTGATLLDSDDTSLSKVEMASPRESRGSQRVDSASGGFPSTPSSAALELIRQGDPNQIIQALFGIVRMGPFPVFMQLVQTWKDHSGSNEVANSLKEAKDGHGHSLLHWAAKRVDSTQFVEYLLQFIPVSVATSSEDTMMTPLHWACTESHALPIVRMLVNHDRCAVEIADSTGCTPLLIAAQHGQVETVAYLLHHGANLHAVDASRDSATHWAAYKGSLQVLGLLSFYDTRQLTTTDTYGQTPLHLASLRGHKSVCKYILSHVDGKQAVQLLNLRDSNGRTPHALAVHKDKHSVATFLADYYDELTCPKSQKYRRLLQRNLRNMVSPAAWRLWLGITVDSSDVDESPLFPYYYVCAHMLINPIFQLWVFWSVGDASEGVLWDSVLLLVWQMVLYVCGLYSFVVTSSMNPGRIDSSFPHLNKWRQLYESTLEQYASSSAPVASLPQLCHTCHIARPLRSKHDRFTDSCILLFDHHCPFVGNSIGLDNYKWFFMFLAATSLFLLQHCILILLWWKRQSDPSLLMLILGAFLGVHVVFPAGMLVYHAKLISVNMTTNESMNASKYFYLWEAINDGQSNGCDGCESDHSQDQHVQRHSDFRFSSTRRFRNPFDKGCCANIIDRLVHPSERSYSLDEQMKSLLPAQGRFGRSDGDADGDPHAV